MAETKDRNKGKDKGQAATKGRWLGPWQMAGLGLIVVAGLWHFGKHVSETSGYLKPRQIRCTFSDANESPVSGVVVQRQSYGGAGAGMEGWRNYGGPSDPNGRCAFVIGGCDMKVTTTTHLWGLFKKLRQDHPTVEYRFALGGVAMPPMREEVLAMLPEVGRVDPNDAGYTDPLPQRALDPNGTMPYSTLGIRIGAPGPPDQTPPPDPNVSS
ncbi:MAG TPA: hypothetical protein ENN81_11435 [Phycisphaerales bacterium]|nr:hypothetical protein [Phycisphaerales bacterium]